MSDKNQYIKPILVLLKEKQELARNELKKTDLNGARECREMEKWFSEIETIIARTPPEYYVENIILYEDARGTVGRVEYEYCDRGVRDHIPSLRIIAELA